MDRNAIAALAKGMVPIVREVVAEANAPLAARLAALEALPIEKGDTGPPGERGEPGPAGRDGRDATELVPPEFAEQIAGAVRLLHESPPIAQNSITAPRVTRIERDGEGNFVPVYGEPAP